MWTMTLDTVGHSVLAKHAAPRPWLLCRLHIIVMFLMTANKACQTEALHRQPRVLENSNDPNAKNPRSGTIRRSVNNQLVLVPSEHDEIMLQAVHSQSCLTCINTPALSPGLSACRFWAPSSITISKQAFTHIYCLD